MSKNLIKRESKDQNQRHPFYSKDHSDEMTSFETNQGVKVFLYQLKNSTIPWQANPTSPYSLRQPLKYGRNPYSKVVYEKELDYQYHEIEGTQIFLHRSLSYLLEEIRESTYILNLKANWDDEGSNPYRHAVWDKSILFLLKYAEKIFEKFGCKIESPSIYHGPHGSIDIRWEVNDAKILINIPDDSNQATYYGKFKNQQAEGDFDLESFRINFLPFIEKR